MSNNDFKEIKKENDNSQNFTENDLRPRSFSDYIGQDHIKEELDFAIKASKIEDEPLPHILFYGAPGLGKTTIANIIANERGTRLHITSAPIIERPADLVSMLMSLEKGDVLFIDEIHAFKTKIEESLYSVLEDFRLDIPIDQGGKTKLISIPLQPFTLVAATTRPGAITQPLRNRFPISHQLKFYSNDELSQIIKRSSKIKNIKIDDDASLEIAKRSRSTARLANNLLNRLKSFAIVENNNYIDLNLASKRLDDLNIDKLGLTEIDRKMIFCLNYVLDNKPAGLKRLGSHISEDEKTIESIVEPFLIQKGLLKKTNKGRMLTDLGIKYAEENIKPDEY